MTFLCYVSVLGLGFPFNVSKNWGKFWETKSSNYCLSLQIFSFDGWFTQLCGILRLEKLFEEFANFHPKDKEKLYGASTTILCDWDSRVSEEGTMERSWVVIWGFHNEGVTVERRAGGWGFKKKMTLSPSIMQIAYAHSIQKCNIVT